MGALPTGTVTFLFTDIEGSTALGLRLGDAFGAVIDRHHALMRAAIDAAGGTTVSTEGDAFFAVFTSAGDAVRSAAAAQRAIAAEPWQSDTTLRVRMGIHTGVGRLGGDSYAGSDVNRAARVAAAGHGGQVLLSEATRALVTADLPAGVALRDLGEHRLKDLPTAERIYQLDIDGLTADFPPLRAAGLGNLPDPVTSFVGREAEIAAVAALLERARLVTLTGPGGTGKTRLSIEVARSIGGRFPDGAWFVALDAVVDPALVLPAIATVLGVPEEAGRSVETALVAHLATRRLLIVLDNFEQVVEAAGAIGRLAAAGPDVRILVSSREILRLAGEQGYPVPPLESDPAEQLFLERARLVRPDISIDGADREAIRLICERLERLPLAIELAAARTRLFPPRQLLTRLDHRFATLSSDLRDLPLRQRTLRGAIDWSYDLLPPPERTVFARLAVFSGGADIEAIEAVVDPSGSVGIDALDATASLTEKSLVIQRDDGHGNARFRMLETIREYASERLAADPDVAEVHVRHADHYLRLAERLEPEFAGQDAAAFFATLETEHDNLRAAIAWSIEKGRPDIGLRVGSAIWRFWHQRGHLAEGVERLNALLAAAESGVTPSLRARSMAALGGMYWWQGDYEATGRVYREVLDARREMGDPAGIAGALFDLSFVSLRSGDMAAATEMLTESGELFGQVGDTDGVFKVNEAMAAGALISHDYERALVLETSIVDENRRRGLGFRLADSLGLLTIVTLRLNDPAAARRHLAECIAVYDRIGDVSSGGFVVLFAAMLAVVEGRPADAARLCGARAAMLESSGPTLTPIDTLGLTDPEEQARAILDPASFDRAYAEGKTWDQETIRAQLLP